MKNLAIYYGYQNWSRWNIEKGFVFSTIEELEQWLNSLTTYCNIGYPQLELNDKSREKVEEWLKNNEKPLFFKTTGCGAWQIKLQKTDCNTFGEYKQQRDYASAKKAKEREQKRLGELFKQKKGWYRVNLELTGDGVITSRFSCKDFTGEVIAVSGAEAYEKAIKECEVEAPGYFAADMMGRGYSFEFLGVKTDDGYSVALWKEWKANGTI